MVNTNPTPQNEKISRVGVSFTKTNGYFQSGSKSGPLHRSVDAIRKGPRVSVVKKKFERRGRTTGSLAERRWRGGRRGVRADAIPKYEM